MAAFTSDAAQRYNAVMPETLLTVSLLLLAAAVVGCVVLWKQRGLLVAERDQLERQLADERQSAATLQTDLAVLRERSEGDAKRLEEFKQQLDNHLKALTGEALKSSREQFIAQADQKLAPIGKLLGEYREMLRDIEGKRTGAYSKITEQIEALKTQQQHLQGETANLVKALRRPEVRGRWGEMQMQRLFELAGMTEHVDFDAQATQESGDRPDFVIHLPNERVIVIDVKTPVDAYLDATEATDEQQRQAHLQRHARQVREKAKNLAGKAYQDQLPGSPEFTVLFIPGEAMLYAAVQQDPDLIEWAMEKNIVIATPTLVMALLKTVAMGWREKSLAENAEKIAETGAELYRRLGPLFAHLHKLGNSIKSTNNHYNSLVGSLESSVLPQARRMESLDSNLTPHEDEKKVKSIEINPRILSAPEAVIGEVDKMTDKSES